MRFKGALTFSKHIYIYNFSVHSPPHSIIVLHTFWHIQDMVDWQEISSIYIVGTGGSQIGETAT